LALTIAMLAHGSGATRTLDGLGVGLAAMACLPLLVHRRWPLGVFVACTLASAAIEALGYALGPPLGATVALFYVAVDPRAPERMRHIAVVVAALGAAHVGVAAASSTGFPTLPILGAIIVWGGAWIMGDQLRQRRQRLADLRGRAEQAEREAARERRLAVAEERNRIARDLHDSAAHAINVILVQAGAARLLQERDPEAARSALTTIEDVARETIGEIDQLVRGLRDDGAAEDAVEPPTGLGALDTLVERHRAAGMAVDVREEGRPRPLAPSLDQAAYRILQESLTNAARHGGGSAAVAIAYRDARLELDVENPLAPVAAQAPLDGGHGILGMRERAALLGGTLAAGRRDGTFRVRAELPYGPGEDGR
jgi:signal transduction histidine kinase